MMSLFKYTFIHVDCSHEIMQHPYFSHVVYVRRIINSVFIAMSDGVL
jgi:hypothetical protein